MNYRISASLALGIILLADTAWAHHSTNLAAQDVTLTGTLTKLDWRNPHVQFSLEVKGDQGQAESWIILGQAPNALANRKISKTDFDRAIGQTVIVEVTPYRDGSRKANVQKITFPGGKVVAVRGQ